MNTKNECCPTPSIAVFDFLLGDVKITNRVCLKCRTRWYGPDEDIKQYTRQEWDQVTG